MTGIPHDNFGSMPSYDEIQLHMARARAMRAEYVALTLRNFGRLIIGRGAKASAAPHGARTA